jgi:hypothetical protein
MSGNEIAKGTIVRLQAVKNLERMNTTDAADAEMCLYRSRTTALLRRYLQLSVELGRVPSLLGREFFRSRVTSYRMHNFEDVVIFVHDVERCLEKLDETSQQLLVRIVLQEYTYEQAARLLGCNPRTVERRYPEALDRFSEMLLERGLLEGMDGERRKAGDRSRRVTYPPRKPVTRVEACQEAKIGRFAISC